MSACVLTSGAMALSFFWFSIRNSSAFKMALGHSTASPASFIRCANDATDAIDSNSPS